jgi:hypothetical protein
MMRNGEWSEKERHFVCEPLRSGRRKKVKTTTHTHITRGEKKTIQNQVIKLFMKLYEKMKEKKAKKRIPAIDENEWKAK